MPKNWPTRSSCLMSTARKLRVVCECFLCSTINFLARPRNWHLDRILPLRASKAISVRSSKRRDFHSRTLLRDNTQSTSPCSS